MTLPYSTTIGIDISKKSLDLYHSARQQVYRYQNTDQGIFDLLNFVQENPVDCILFEPTGGYEKRLLEALVEKNYLLR